MNHQQRTRASYLEVLILQLHIELQSTSSNAETHSDEGSRTTLSEKKQYCYQDSNEFDFNSSDNSFRLDVGYVSKFVSQLRLCELDKERDLGQVLNVGGTVV